MSVVGYEKNRMNKFTNRTSLELEWQMRRPDTLDTMTLMGQMLASKKVCFSRHFSWQLLESGGSDRRGGVRHTEGTGKEQRRWHLSTDAVCGVPHILPDTHGSPQTVINCAARSRLATCNRLFFLTPSFVGAPFIYHTSRSTAVVLHMIKQNHTVDFVQYSFLRQQ